MKSRAVSTIVVSFFCLISAANSSGQARPGSPTVAPPTQMGPPPASFGSPYSSVTVIVADANGANLGQQALVKLYSNSTQTNVWGTTQDRSQIIFDQVPPSDYEVEVSAAGYETTTKDLSVMTAGQNYDLIVRLKRDESGAVTNPIPGQVIAPKALKEVNKGIADIRAKNLVDAEKHFDAALKLAPTNADVNYLLGFLYLQKNDPAQAQTYLTKATSLNPQHVRALTALGESHIQQKDYKGAIGPLEQAVSANSQDWQANWLLATAYLQEHEFEEARKHAEVAVQKGRGAASGAQLVLGECLVNLGRTAEAIQVLNAFLRDASQSPVWVEVHDMVGRLENSEKSSTAPAPPSTAPALTIAKGGAPARVDLDISAWAPASIDVVKPAIAPGVTCPAQKVIDGAAKRARELVDDLARFDATEELSHEEVDELGNRLTRETLKFDYIVSIAEQRKGLLTVEEYRSALTSKSDAPGGISTRGLPALALIFHPDMRDNYDMVCEGLGDLQSQATWLVHFRQRPDRPSRILGYEFTNGFETVDLKGRAWIAATTFQIMRIEAEMVSPMPKIQLLSQHEIVEYAPVRFKQKNTELWLPKDADLYFDFRGHRYHRRHSFGNYKLFSVAADQKIGDPKETDESKTPPSKPQHQPGVGFGRLSSEPIDLDPRR